MDAERTVQAYVDRVYNEGDVDALTAFCADPYTRHEAGSMVVMTHAQQLERVTRARDSGGAADGRSLSFSTVLVTSNGTDVCWLWDMTAPADCSIARSDMPFEVVDDEIHMCGAEIFRVVDRLITEVWNPPPMPGRWG